MTPKLVYAIDYGTSNSLLGAASATQTLSLCPLDNDASDQTILRSIIYLPSMREIYFGKRAIQEFINHDMEGRLIRSIKKYLPIRSFIGTYVDDRPMNLEDIIAAFLREMRRRANEHFRSDVDAVVLGRPARFSDNADDDKFAQYRLERAAREAGFKHIEFFAEPIAAAFGFRKKMQGEKIVAVVDLGGGTSDFTVMRLDQGNYRESSVLAIGGVSIAGDALDSALMRSRIIPHFGSDVTYKVPFGSNVLKMPVSLMEKLCSPPDISLLRKRDTIEFFKNVQSWALGGDDRRKMDNLFCLLDNQLGFSVFEEIEGTKRRLSDSIQTQFHFQYPGLQIRESISRNEFNAYAQERVDRIMGTLDETLREAQVSSNDVDVVVCTGGTARVPVIFDELVRRFGRQKIEHHNFYHGVVEGLCDRAKELAAGF